MLRTKSLRAALLLPAAMAVSYLTGIGTASAQTPLDTQLAAYSADEAATGSGKSVTTATAQANDLVYAVYTVLFNNPGFSNAQVAQIASQALTTVANKTRADKDKIVGRIVSAAVYGSHAENDPVRIKAILDAVGTVNAGGKKALTVNGRAVAIASALRAAAPSVGLVPSDFTSTSQNSGAAIAASANSLVIGNPITFHKTVIKALGTGGGADNLAAYVNGVLDSAAFSAVDKNTAAIQLASAAGANPVTAGGVIAGRAADITNFTPAPGSNAAVEALVLAAAKTAALKKSINGVVAGGFAYLDPTRSRGAAAAVVAADPKVKASAGLVAAGALQSRPALSGENTGTVLNAVIQAAGTQSKSYAAFAGQAALGNGPVADEIVSFMVGVTPSTGANAKNAQLIATAVIKSIGVAADPADISDAAAAAANSTIGGAAVFTSDAAKATLAAGLAKGAAKSYLAAGAAVAGVLSTETSIAGNAAGISASSIKANSKAATAIAQQVSALLASTGGPGAVSTYTNSLVNQVTAANAGAVIAGSALTVPANTGSLITGAINAGSSAVKAQTLKIANTVATNVDIERIGDVAKAVGLLLQPKSGGTAGLPKITSFGSLATALGKAINTKPLRDRNVPNSPNGGWHNRVDELGELAATLVSAALTGPSGGIDAKTLGSIGTGIYKSVSKKLLANAGNNLADLKDVAEDVAGAIFQTISVTSLSAAFTQQVRDALLTAGGPLETALKKAAGKSFADRVTLALTHVNSATGSPGRLYTEAGSNEQLSNGGSGKYEVGNIVDPETPAKNI